MSKKLICIVILVAAGWLSPQSLATEALNTKPISVQSLQPLARNTLLKGLNSENAILNTYAIEVAAETNQKDMLPLIIKLAESPAVAVRFAAIVALGDMQVADKKDVIQKALNDPNVNVRIAGAYSLRKLSQKRYVDQIRAATKSNDQTVRANAALLLGKLGDKDNIELLYEVLSAADSTDKVRIQAVESIALLGDEQMYRSKLWALLISKFSDDRVMGIRGMGALNTSEARNAIATMLEDEVQEVRLAAAEQLGRLGDKRGEELIWKYFQQSPNLNKNDMANRMAVMAIGSLGTNRLNSLLPSALSSQSATIQLMAARSVLIQYPNKPQNKDK